MKLLTRIRLVNWHLFENTTINCQGTTYFIGINGAGKSTILRAISGLLKPRRGTISFNGRNVTGLPADRMAALGVVMVPEGRHIFADLTVRENLRLGAYCRTDQDAVEADMVRGARRTRRSLSPRDHGRSVARWGREPDSCCKVG